jgi:hypothetical protein
VVGKKRFHILPPDAAHLLEPSTSPSQKNTSTIPIPVSRISNPINMEDEPEVKDIPPVTLSRYRKSLEEAFRLPGACEVDVSAGESVLVPEGWWHSAEGLDGPGVGVGVWFR